MIRLLHSSSEPGNQFIGLAPVASSTVGLKVRFLRLAPFANRNNVVHLQIDSPPASSTAASVAHQYCRAHAVRHPSVSKEVLPARLFRRGEVDEVGERAEV